MALDLPLERMQRWFQGMVVHPEGCDAALVAPEAEQEVPLERLREVILPSRTLTPAERLEIYHGMYPLRMQEALASDYPALEHFLGDDGFRELVMQYVQEFPSRNYSLNRLGDHVPEFVRSAPGIKRPEFCHELARLELAISQVFDAPEVPALTAEQIAAVAPEDWERARLRPIAAFRLLSFRYPVNAYVQSVRDEDHAGHPKARLKDTWLALYRRSYSVYRLELSRSAHDLLRDLVEGATLGEAVAAAPRRDGRRAPQEEELFRWFRDWVSGGIFASVELDGERR
ncbi:MAG: putative DNA-binding domain-containing protein [Acidobacteria bacterium]|nr:putative DNA-binding domain-containing protein [Acidobacteriota bacterium]